MTAADKTVGGRTREEWDAAYVAGEIGYAEMRDLALAAHSRGIRDGLERAAMIAESIVGWGGVGQEIAKRIRRAEASKLDGAGSHACGDAGCIVPHPPAGKTKPPAEERKLP